MRKEAPVPPAACKWRILWLDDNEDVVECFQMIIQNAPGIAGTVEIQWVHHGDVARLALARKLPDIFVTDILHPGCKTLELLRWLQVQHARIPVIMCSGFGMPTLHDKLQKLFAAKFTGMNIAMLPKPCSMEDMLRAVREACELARLSRA